MQLWLTSRRLTDLQPDTPSRVVILLRAATNTRSRVSLWSGLMLEMVLLEMSMCTKLCRE